MPAPLPPADFSAREIPLVPLRAGVWRRLAHVSRLDPLGWDGRPGATRFVSPSGGYEMMYLASDKPTAFWEVFSARLLPLAPKDRVLPPRALEERRWAEFTISAGFEVFDATSIRALRSIGASNMSFHGDWSASQAWGEALWKHPDAPAGILYRSDKNARRCVALFRRKWKAGQRVDASFGPLLVEDRPFLAAMRKGGHIAG